MTVPNQAPDPLKPKLGAILTVDDDPRYSQPYANALSVAAWVCPLALNNAYTGGSTDQYVHFLEKAVDSSIEVEWAMRLYNQTNPNAIRGFRFTRLSWSLPPVRGMAPIWSMASRRMTRRLSSWAAGFSSWGKRNRGSRKAI